MRFILFGTGAERRKEQIWRQIEQLLFGVALSPRCIAAKDRSHPLPTLTIKTQDICNE
jgi:hypothetical protein